MRSTLSVADKLVLAASDLERNAGQTFSAEDLVVAAWRMFPGAFGLAGYKGKGGSLLYPDSNRVFAEIMGSKPIRKRGYLTKVGSKMYQLTESGRAYACLLHGRPTDDSVERAGLSRSLLQELLRLLEMKAMTKYQSGRSDEITFHDACSFWGISPRTSAIGFDGRVENVRGVVDSVEASLGGKDMATRHGGTVIGKTDIDRLREVHAFLLERFRSEIEVIKRRTDERA